MIDQLEFNQNQDNLGTTRSTAYTNARSAGSSTSRTSASNSSRSGSSSTSRSSATSSSFLDRLRNATSRAVQVVNQAQDRTASAPATSSNNSSSSSRNAASGSTSSSGGSRNSTSTVTKTTGRSGVEHDSNAPRQVTTGQSGQRATRAESPEENSQRMQATYYLNEFKEIAKQVEEQGFVLTQTQYTELQNIIAQYQQSNGDSSTLSLMMQYSQLEVEGGRPTSNPMMAAFGDIDSKKAIYIGAGLLGLVLLKKMAKRNDN
ncbi:hypothetical protein OKW21_005009 [Catalinimonas alkaloidigena]|uniref:hypothetical protein n=1 Tax=Catalinimonas alkaloidigena TaxID=1075417 RepID=UPI0024057CDB|nr:hypothetical protein [Catalinimonas alkaloidigena]MDF9799746.1 hypothetical protein [Catalinimonas alkaloidigena]